MYTRYEFEEGSSGEYETTANLVQLQVDLIKIDCTDDLAQVENATVLGDTEANTALAKLHLERLRNQLFTPLSSSPDLLLLAVRHRDLDLVDHVMKKRKPEYVTGGLLEAARKGYYKLSKANLQFL